MHNQKNTNASGFIFAFAGVFLFSLKPIFVKMAYEFPIDSVTLMTLRLAMSLPIYMAIGFWLLIRNKVDLPMTKKALPGIIVTGLLGYYGASYFDLTGLHYISAQLERLILFSYPGLVVLIGFFFFKNPIKKGTVPALILTYTGIAALFVHDVSLAGSSQILGGSLVFASALLFALYILFSKDFISSVGSLVFTCIAMCAASAAILLHFLLTNHFSDLQQPVRVYQIAFAIALFSTVLPSFLISEAINRLGTNTTSIIGSSGALFTSILAVTILGERFTQYHVLSLILVTTGIVLLGRKK